MNLIYPRLNHIITAGESLKWQQASALMTAQDANQASFYRVAQFYVRPKGGDLYLLQVLPGKAAPGAGNTDITLAQDQIADGEFRFFTMEGSPTLDWWDLATLWVLGAQDTRIYLSGVSALLPEDIK